MRRLATIAALLGIGAGTAADADDAAREARVPQLWGTVLARHTRPVDDAAGVRVDYAAIAGSKTWSALLAALAAADPAALPGRDARLAFWINAYNVLAIDVVVRNRPLESIRDAGSFLRPVWKRPAGAVGGRTRTLDQVEHEILRPMGEPRIHAAIVCASVSCPDLRREPYRAETLDAQLDDAMGGFLADPRKGLRLEREAETIRLSPIFKWFAKDFTKAGGVRAFVLRYRPADERHWATTHSDADLAFFDYDWRLNDLASVPSS